jgi:predicted DNA-binding protein YlxM (UPF0122 family)
MLKPKQEKCIKLMLLGSMSQSQIAQELKVTEQTICNWKKNDEFTEKLEQGNRQIISSMVPRAINKLQALLDADSEQVQLAAAKDILDRAGYRAPKEIQIDANVQQETTALQGILAQLSTPPADL